MRNLALFGLIFWGFVGAALLAFGVFAVMMALNSPAGYGVPREVFFPNLFIATLLWLGIGAAGLYGFKKMRKE